MSARPSIRLRLDGVPPNSSTLDYAFGAPLRAAAEPWRERIAQALRDGYELPEEGRLQVELTLAFADRRRRVAANYVEVLRRALVDALADLGCDCALEGFTVQLAKRAREATSIKLTGEGGSR